MAMFSQAQPLSQRTSRKPSPYPSIPFNLLRLSLLLSALIVASVLIFFVDHLRDEGYSIPWTFILLLTTSVLSILHLCVTTYIHITRTLTPSGLLISNAFLAVCWLLSLALLTWNLSWTLGHHCAITTWHNEAGIMVCRMYKALTAFAVTGAAATIGAVFLDLSVSRRSKERGVYNQMADIKTPVVRESEVNGTGFEDQQLRHGEGWDRRSHDGARAYKLQKPIEAKQFGYELPSEQTKYAGGSNWM